MDHHSFSRFDDNLRVNVNTAATSPDDDSAGPADTSPFGSDLPVVLGDKEPVAVSVDLRELDTLISVAANRPRRRRESDANVSAKNISASEDRSPVVRTSICFRIERSRVAQYRQYIREFEPSSPLANAVSPHFSDPVLKRLTAALALAEERGSEFDGLYADAVRLAIVTRILSLQNVTQSAVNRQAAPLQNWRLKRVLEYVKRHYAKTIKLQDLAGAAGLSRMHFAAQFRLATGLRPREFVVQYRIEMARRLLAETNESVVDIALAVGFQSQSHFTTVFRQCVGETPRRWRGLNFEPGALSSRGDSYRRNVIAA
ncbi:AraC family transcriptional regulator [Bradyrhizobium sp. MOS001]|uniref:helix-turn-helix transcriptional regulator n=1 Tax=Bradyrhizobium sp. MOS001 TaxID=2133948 RepID=UPI0010753D20|nr:AraC family transcriptional regulator [Bradyrhizobium sp. MOS001]TFW56698.1 AraC family transcriptional regulator [Bradyrhizobium sp. MOS001]